MTVTTRLARRAFLASLTAATGALLAACASPPAAPSPPAGGAAATKSEAKPAAPEPTRPVQIAAPAPATAAPAATKPASATKPAEPAPATKPAEPTRPAAAAKPTGDVKRGGLLKIHRQNDWPGFDPHTAQTFNLEVPLMFDFLTKIERNPQTNGFEIKPSLAESWEIPDPTTVIFKLRKGVKFHDGTDFDAEAARWNLDRVMTHPKSGGKTLVATIDKVEAPDPATLRLKLKAPSPALFFGLASDSDSIIAMMSPTHAKKVGDEGLLKQPVGTGPFRFGDWKPGAEVNLKRFDQYWKMGVDGKPLPYPEDIKVVYQQDWSAALVGLRTGNLDVMNGIAGKDVPQVKSNPDLIYWDAPWQATTYCLCFNARQGARFATPEMLKVRQAVFYAIDRASMAKALGLGIGEPTGYHLVPGQLGYSDKVPAFTYDPEKAKKLLAEAGFGSGIDITLDFISRPEDLQNAQLYKQMLEAVGVRLTLQPQERVAWVQKMQSGKFEFGAFLSGTRPDPDIVVGYRFAKDGPGNYAGYFNAEVEKALEDGRTTYDTAKRQAAYEKAQTLVFDDAFYAFNWRRNGNFTTSKAVKNLGFPWNGPMVNSTEVWLDR